MSAAARGDRRRAPGALGAGAHRRSTCSPARASGCSSATRPRPVLPPAADRQRRHADPAGARRRPGRTARQRASSKAASSHGFDFKYSAGEILLDPGDRADVVAAIPATATGVLTLWTQDFERTGSRRFSNIPTVPVAHFNVTGCRGGPRTRSASGTPLRVAHRRAAVEVLGPATGTLLDPATFTPRQAGMPNRTSSCERPPEASLGINGVQGTTTSRCDFTADATRRIRPLREARRHARVDGHERDRRAPSVPSARLLDPAADADRSRQAPDLHVPAHEFATTSTCPRVHAHLPPARRPAADGRHQRRAAALGRWVFHCHIFFHAVFGMISEFVVVGCRRQRAAVRQRERHADRGPHGSERHNARHLCGHGRRGGDAAASIGTVVDNGGGTWKWDVHDGRGRGALRVRHGHRCRGPQGLECVQARGQRTTGGHRQQRRGQ